MAAAELDEEDEELCVDELDDDDFEELEEDPGELEEREELDEDVGDELDEDLGVEDELRRLEDDDVGIDGAELVEEDTEEDSEDFDIELDEEGIEEKLLEDESLLELTADDLDDARELDNLLELSEELNAEDVTEDEDAPAPTIVSPPQPVRATEPRATPTPTLALRSVSWTAFSSMWLACISSPHLKLFMGSSVRGVSIDKCERMLNLMPHRIEFNRHVNQVELAKRSGKEMKAAG